ncbi:class I SAM-dependent methyltransferase [Planktothrix sp. FACHB-1355]|uniref:Class I SAM-dependent methyltransferase n=1 Tax=Aerosakkonema funiforme FACHB-1375 TaxID=2949571 RepID=A0A926VE49_9CYAN|nr:MULTISPECIES: class I SAM-dependent methyltransferase [Oscillatoriales]MBD2181920.1 class I SAM-dependent methyltransferase [Aerosakkonema funiforme FACHB-1375]MBD3560967.1 class I SAM-dependent methyltransferase [Planktothrix sp. FACHB-1355]
MKDEDLVKSCYSKDLAQRKNWYSEFADAYNKARPRYPKELIYRAVEVAKLEKEATILEVGCGPGNATIAFAELGFSMLCIEPSQTFYQLVRQNCAQYPNVEIRNTSFEEWQLETQRFNAVLAANSWHWIPPEIKYPKAAAALQENGYLILLWNMMPQPAYEVYQALHQVYQSQGVSIPAYEQMETQAEIIRGFGQDIIDSGMFKGLVSGHLLCEVTYNIDDYMTLLSTLSFYRIQDPEKMNFVFQSLRSVLESNWGSDIHVSYLSAFNIAEKV